MQMKMAAPAMLLVLLSGSTASAQVFVQGTVLNTDSARLIGARVQIADSAGRANYTAITDSAGQFVIRLGAPLAARRFHIAAEMIGYRTTTTVLDVDDRQEVDVELIMDVSAIPLEPLRVSARRRYTRTLRDEYFDRAERVKRMGGGTIIERHQLERRAGSSINTIVTENYPSRSCAPSLFIDGLRATPEDLRLTPTSNVEGIEIYRNQAMAPVEYQGRTTCGAVLIWTRIGDSNTGSPLTWRRILLAGALVIGGFLILR
jgi:hypothetical protein